MINIGTLNVDKMYVGQDKVEKIYIGNTLVYQKQTADNFVKFLSANSFTLNVVDNLKYWDGTLEYSTNKSTWTTWDGTSAISSASDGVSNNLYLRGTGNTYITGANSGTTAGHWQLNGTNIAMSGNVETLLDYSTVANGQHPPMADSCFRNMFYGCTSLTDITNVTMPAMTLTAHCYRSMYYGTGITSIPDNFLPATTGADSCYYALFNSCNGLTTVPVNLLVNMTTLANACFNYFFSQCSNLTNAVRLPAQTIQPYCYYGLYYNCKKLVQLSALPAQTLQTYCYYRLYYGCNLIKISSWPNSTYVNDYRIPTSGTGTTADSALTQMFTSTGGGFTSTPSINKTYYTSNTIIS